MFQSNKVIVDKTAHYYTFGTPSPKTKRFWIICHGYGQLASRFIQQFQLLDPEENFILAPEGFHRFYWNGFSGEVVASWMTKADRLEEIKDYTTFLQQLYKQHLAELPENVEIILFGFSQGCATVCRWINSMLPSFHKLVLWAGTLPEDIDYESLLPYLADKEIVFTYGSEDQFLTIENRVEKHLAFAKTVGVDMRVWTFEGKHETRKKVLSEFASQIL